MSIFSGIWVPLITPFADGEVDHAALRALVRRYADAGIAGLVALGTTGEPATLEIAEQDAVLATILDAARPPAAAHGAAHAGARPALPVVAGVSGNHTASMRERIEQLNALPIAGVLMAAPYYIRPSQAGIVGHFTALADASEKPVALYRALSEGRLDEGRRIFQALTPLIQSLFAEPNPAPVKALLAALGLIRDELRMPMTRAGDALVARLRALEGLAPLHTRAAGLPA